MKRDKQEKKYETQKEREPERGKGEYIFREQVEWTLSIEINWIFNFMLSNLLRFGSKHFYILLIETIKICSCLYWTGFNTYLIWAKEKRRKNRNKHFLSIEGCGFAAWCRLCNWFAFAIPAHDFHFIKSNWTWFSIDFFLCISSIWMLHSCVLQSNSFQSKLMHLYVFLNIIAMNFSMSHINETTSSFA